MTRHCLALVAVAAALCGCAGSSDHPGQAHTSSTTSATASSPASSASAAPTDQVSYTANGTQIGGQHPWTPPKVTPAAGAGGRPTVAPGAGPDPVTGMSLSLVATGTGAVVVDPDTARIRYIRQSWDGKHIAHDSWQSPGRGEAVPAPESAQVWVGFRLLLQHSRVGNIYELVDPADQATAVAGQSAVFAIEVAAA